MNADKINPRDYGYDIECYPNCFTYSAKHVQTGQRYKFEISFRRNDIDALIDHLRMLALSNARQVGFNNISYDYTILHFIISEYPKGLITPFYIYQYNKKFFDADKDEKFRMMVWENERYIEQVDLYKIHHFDNVSRATSLKMLEFNMRSNNVEDLPFEPGTFLDSEQIDTLIEYNDWDVDETCKFLIHSYDLIEFREELTEQYGKSFINFSDKKIGSEILILELEKSQPGICYTRENGYRETRQTYRSSIKLREVIFPYISFSTPEFNRVHKWLLSQEITETKGVFKDLSCVIDGFKYDFGTGGIHGSIDSTIVCSDKKNVLIDLDVASYYPNIGIKNKIYPEHLSERFCEVYESIYFKRKQYPKKQYPALNNALKLALNGAYGDSNNVYSPFYDPKYTMSITINGQLMLCMLAEYLRPIPGLKMVQINTDGLTVLCPRKYTGTVDTIRQFWETLTGLELEEARYKRMFIRDVNNYIAEGENGSLKRKGAYCYETNLDKPGTLEVPWHKDHGALIVPKAAEAALVHGANIREFITNHDDFYDFMLREKVARTMKLIIQYQETEFTLPRITRYYVSTNGGQMFKLMQPINRKAYIFIDANGAEHFAFNKKDCKPLEKAGHSYIGQQNRKGGPRRNSVCAGWMVTPCNNIKYADRNTLNYEYYIKEAEKLVNPLRGNTQ